MNQAPLIITTNVCTITRNLGAWHLSSCFCIILLLLALTTLPADAKSAVPTSPVPSRQALQLIEKARRAGKKGDDLIADKLWDKAGAGDRAVPASPPDWNAERNPQQFTASLKNRALTRDELMVLITMLPYQRAQKQLRRYLDRFPLDTELRELSLAMAELHNDARLEKLHESALSGQAVDDYTWLYGMRLLMLLGYIFTIRLILSFRKNRLKAVMASPDAPEEQAGEKL
ncbi:MAG: hypothetical protein GQF41_2467 [Candidatus Rifleibacterium amylolyticum]|nr:MAG: hypothetical protein GQF41_2467 [Candidatus Rifleibacterium amylolyticum]